MQNNFTGKSISQLRIIATQAGSAIGLSPATYGAVVAQVTALTTANAALGTDVTAVETAKANLRAAVETQNANRKAVVASLSLLAKQAYNKPVTSTQLAAAGFAVHDSKPTPINPVAPSNLLAEPFANGSVKLSWTKNNPYGVNYFVEVSVDGGTWTQIYATKRSRITLSNFTPGVATAFRVKAENRNQVTLPSNEAEIYPASAPEMTLRFAA